jgi:para-aminobenzoate synthetase component 1
MRLSPLPYRGDSAELFEAIASEPWSVFLDSGSLGANAGRFDILAARPYITLVTRGDQTEIRQAGTVLHAVDDPFELLRCYLAAGVANSETVAADEESPLPFSGGAIGYFGYDLAWRIERLPDQAGRQATGSIPEMAVGIYDWAVVVDHQLRRSWLVGGERDAATAASWDALLALFGTPPAAGRDGPARPAFRVGKVARDFTPAQYRQAFVRIQRYIQAGDCYQVNLAQRFSAPVSGDPWLAYQALRRINPAPCSAYLNLPDACILSSSPERFLALRAGRVTTRPIKGTRPRAASAEEDAALARELAASEKDRAENLMIVDLLRNDLGKVCQPGSVTTPGLFEIESFASVHHLVSTVSGQLAPGCDAIGLLRAAFPGGSITGAPKLRAMQIIAELESHPRQVYCGAIGWLGFNGDMDSNIAIRTLVVAHGQVHFWAGGGIVADSNADAEYRECFDKAAALLRLLRACGGEIPSLVNEKD